MARSFKLSNIVAATANIGSSRSVKVRDAVGKGRHWVRTRSVIVAAVKSNQIIPAASMVRRASGRADSDSSKHLTLSFSDAFGVLGVPMILTLLVCIIWTTWLIVATWAPNQAANWLMGTGNYDNGQFWLITGTNPHIINAGAVGLIFVDVCYFYVLVKMLRWRKTIVSIVTHQEAKTRLEEILRSSSATNSRMSTAYLHSKGYYKELTSFRGANRKYWNVCVKVFNLSMQTTILLELLTDGSPVALVYTYTAFISMGSLAGALKIWIGKFSALGEVVAGSVFDLFAAVVYPVGVLVYCYYNFQFDDDVFATYLAILPPGSYERTARVFADPSEIAFFRLTFDSLRIRSVLDFILRVGINLSFCYRIMRIGDVLISVHHRNLKLGRAPRSRPTSNRQKAVPKAFATVFIVCSIVVWIFATQTIEGSRARCSRYPQCVVYAYHWGSSDGSCPCRILIDIDTTPTTYEDWIRPIDVYNDVRELAISGELRSLQLINRQLFELPEELKTCTYLTSIELIYTSLKSIPSWAKGFKYLETLHLEGKQDSQNLLLLPEDLFSNMPWLSMVHVGVHPNLANFPPLRGVPNLQSLTLAWLFALREMPSFDRVPQLHQLILAFLPQLERLPDMTPLQRLSDFTISRPVHLCCNGFRGVCDLNDNYCMSSASMGIPAATCLNEEPFLGSVGTRAVFNKFTSKVCQKLPSDGMLFAGGPTKYTIEMCDSKPFGQCQLPDGQIGICYNIRMQVLSCYGDDNYIKLRRYQIQKGVGQPCDPVVEKWLGCVE